MIGVLEIGDCVIFALDGARGIVMEIKLPLCHVIWEDFFVSWEDESTLRKDERLTVQQRLFP
ncbi:hypothetical protein DQG23_15730 [Paenibacillus contaminans]|uniref:DUF3006 domain-containing protein n=1 Tax=Paenibacillus contaminans TaxID=450362 RepID=A0A329MKU9_9BACL|nr:hypothetical protein DQG23_15730 [Paenibacillus contaminans]